jgi:diaminopimelate epimerase
MNIVKVHSLGNDFLIVDEAETQTLADPGAVARRICERHTGIGADCLLLINIKDRNQGIVDFRVFNADGTESELSGNGLRCAAAYLSFEEKIDSSSILFQTVVGQRRCDLVSAKNNLFEFKIEMGFPRLNSKDIPFDDGTAHEKIIDYPLSIQQKVYPVTVLSLGNPHCAIFFDRYPSRIEWQQIGQEIEHHPFFPNRTNIEFIRVQNPTEIEVLFWERGVGETMSSGSGSCAAAVASILKGLTEKTVTVHTSMGNLTVEWEGEVVHQIGPSEVVYEGRFIPGS